MQNTREFFPRFPEASWTTLIPMGGQTPPPTSSPQNELPLAPPQSQIKAPETHKIYCAALNPIIHKFSPAHTASHLCYALHYKMRP